jgi:hypothetical protein
VNQIKCKTRYSYILGIKTLLWYFWGVGMLFSSNCMYDSKQKCPVVICCTREDLVLLPIFSACSQPSFPRRRIKVSISKRRRREMWIYWHFLYSSANVIGLSILLPFLFLDEHKLTLGVLEHVCPKFFSMYLQPPTNRFIAIVQRSVLFFISGKSLGGDGRKVFGNGGKCCCGLHHTVTIMYNTNRQNRFLLTPQISLSLQKGNLCFLLSVPSCYSCYCNWIGGLHGEFSKKNCLTGSGFKSFSKEYYANI